VARSIPVACRLTTYWLASPVTAPLRGVAEERPASPKVGVPSSLFQLCRGKERFVPFFLLSFFWPLHTAGKLHS
jgi:hypothetical protein